MRLGDEHSHAGSGILSRSYHPLVEQDLARYAASIGRTIPHCVDAMPMQAFIDRYCAAAPASDT